MEDSHEGEVTQGEKRWFTLGVEVFADSDAELREIAEEIGGEVFGRIDVLSVNVDA